MTWEPGQYLKYASERLRPALDLLARIPLAAPGSVVDLGCGAGNVTRILAERWLDARIVGVDNSEAMLAKAREAGADRGNLSFQSADLAAWADAVAPASIDLVYSNAALHWLDDHATLFPRLMRAVAPGGMLAVQMPSNFHAPSHVVLQDVAGGPRWHAQLGALLRPGPVAPAVRYFEWLSPHARTVDMWTTEYLHVLPPASDGEHPVIAWIKGTALTPFLALLGADAQRAFIRDCAERIAQAYPALPDGRVVYPFRRVFVAATRENR
ncbi:MAG: methyltransferase domain-containing protein [Casimicrobiaceae bacterium]